ncbi:MAG: WecB/TagA/CpsF family glycosyltransferase [Sphingopyxis sp.]|uniref:WecB/TagA/CpsF family glycosyltransferase n=1 Tax=Sphingopyxis sp. TaxID=1908224 RepID=UPI001A36BE09|nr:WecB/TagA/CpsF family glycosyltransferase [Sphingopyxis sp.]MBL9068886.1 WecB/TagA/CpsF family glycosyltransferase [Sphingopyxis sp.]
MRVAAPDRIDFLGLHFDALDAAAVRRSVVALARSSSFSYVVTPNVDHIVQLHRSPDPEIIRIYDAAALCICDSRIIARLAAFSGISLAAVPGSDVTRDLLCGELPDCRVAVIGGDSELHRNLEALYPRFAWTFHIPPMGVRRDPEARDAIAVFVEAMQADVILFAIGAPQSEIVCGEIAARGRSRGIALCIGASLEFLTGAKQRAPRWMQRAGLEWLFRLVSEPRRLWRRYLVDGPAIFPIWWRWRTLNADRARSGSKPSDDA